MQHSLFIVHHSFGAVAFCSSPVFSSPVIHDEHIQLLPAAQFLVGEQQLLLQFVGSLLGGEGHQAFECTGHQISTGNAAEEAFGEIPLFQGIEDIEQILFQGVVLIHKGETDEHIAVHHPAGIVDLAAAAGGGDGADGEGGTEADRKSVV